jgi:hypothetical protein
VPSRSRLQLSAGAALAAAVLRLAGPLAGQTPAARTPPIWIYFPPIPPVLGAPRAPAAAAPAWPAPSELAAFVTEPFYAPLSAALKGGGTDPVLDAELEAYHSDREALLAELRAQLATLRDADSPTRRKGLAAFSAEVQPRVLALERRAEQLRAELAQGGGRNQFLRWSIDFADLTDAQANDRTVQSWLLEVDSFYLPGLSPNQRALLREIALGLRTPADPSAPGTLFFSPSPSRIPLPDHPSGALQSELDAYRRLKERLAAALVETAYPRERAAANARSRAAALAALAPQQEPGFAELERLAERIRGELADRSDPSRSPDPPMPAALAAQVAAWRKDNLALQRDLLARVDAVRYRASPESRPATPAEIRQAIAAFTQENAARYAALNRTRDLIREETARLASAGNAGDAASGALQARFSDSLRQLESYWDYHDYQIAVLQPGISPGLRRILLEGGVEKLALPLPGAVMQPP